MILVSQIQASHRIAIRLLHADLNTSGGSAPAVQKLIDSVNHLKRRTLSSGRSWQKLLSFARTSTLSELFIELECIAGKGFTETRASSRSFINNLPTSLQLPPTWLSAV